MIRSSDAARETLAGFWDSDLKLESAGSGSSGLLPLPSFESWCLDPSLGNDVLLSTHKRALSLIESEGLEILDTHPGPGRHRHPMRDVGRHTDAIAMCYGALEDMDNFLAWISKAADAREAARPEERLAFRKWMSNPMEFPVWGWRKTCCPGKLSEVVDDHETAGSGSAQEMEDFSSVGGLADCVKMGMFDCI